MNIYRRHIGKQIAELEISASGVWVTGALTHETCKRLYTQLRDILDAANDRTPPGMIDPAEGVSHLDEEAT